MRKPMGQRTPQWAVVCLAIFFGISAKCWGQNTLTQASPHGGALPSGASALESEIKDLQFEIAVTKSQIAQMETRTARLQVELDDIRAQLGMIRRAQKPAAALAEGKSPNMGANRTLTPSHSQSLIHTVQKRLASLQNHQDLLQSEIRDQNQVKVESASKYRLKLSGIALVNVFDNRGNEDNLDVPQLAEAPGSLSSNAVFGATVRQSEIGLQVFGPSLAGARIYGDVQTDFFGGFPSVLNGGTSAIMRIRTATVHMVWHNTSLVAGQDALFFSPVSPTSFASLAEPAFAYSGDLWAWTPQIRLEHRFNYSESSALVVQGGILDALTGEPPFNSFYKTAQAGEMSGQPAYAGRVAWTRTSSDRTASLGVGGYYSSENWGFGRRIPGWAGTADWSIPLGRWFGFSGEFYRGHAIGGLGAGTGRSVLYNGSLTNPLTSVLGLNSVGGWGQLKFRPLERLEFNLAFGEDEPFASDIRHFSEALSYFNPSIDRNESGLVNLIYYPRSDLVLSLEYRRYRTSEIEDSTYRAGQINLGIGLLF